jgi:hypothetical protein
MHKTFLFLRHLFVAVSDSKTEKKNENGVGRAIC